MDKSHLKEHLRKGMTAARAGRKEEARLAFEAVLSDDAKNETALLWLCYLSDDPNQSMGYVSKALRYHLQSPRVYGALQWTLKRQAATRESPPPGHTPDTTSLEPKPASVPRNPLVERMAFLAALVLAATSVGWATSLMVRGEPIAAAALEPTTASPVTMATSGQSDHLVSSTPSPLPPTPSPPPPTATPSPSPTPSPTATPLPPTVTPIPTIPVPASASHVGVGRWIDVDLTNQVLTAYDGDNAVHSVLVSTGRSQTPTPTGQYRIYVKFVTDDMQGVDYFLPAVPWVMYFHGGYGIHGTFWHDNFGEQMSHGCVNLPPSEAEWLFNWSEVGTLVNIHY